MKLVENEEYDLLIVELENGKELAEVSVDDTNFLNVNFAPEDWTNNDVYELVSMLERKKHNKKRYVFN